jgi:hypothetical protein
MILCAAGTVSRHRLFTAREVAVILVENHAEMVMVVSDSGALPFAPGAYRGRRAGAKGPPSLVTSSGRSLE